MTAPKSAKELAEEYMLSISDGIEREGGAYCLVEAITKQTFLAGYDAGMKRAAEIAAERIRWLDEQMYTTYAAREVQNAILSELTGSETKEQT